MQALDIPSTRALEDLCINTIYASLLTGKLSPQTQTFQITSCTSRDVSATSPDYAGMIAILTQWSRQCDLVLAEITGRMRDVKVAAANRKKAEEEYEREVNSAKKGGGKKAGMAKGAGKGSAQRGEGEEEEVETMQEVEEAGSNAVVGAGGESPTGRKRKYVRLPDVKILTNFVGNNMRSPHSEYITPPY
jgi:COP9 signalosome complex subunit 7